MFKDSLQLLALNFLPQHLVSRAVGRFAHSPLSKSIIPVLIKRFAIDASQAEKPLDAYETLNEFFTRRLKPGLRPIQGGAKDVVSPVDGRVSAHGKILKGKLWQVKGKTYSLADLLNGDKAMVERFTDGEFVTIYLSPQDYHRIHMPLGGKLVAASYVPGALFPVNDFAVRNVSNLFARNERLITYAETPAGLMALLKVGATMVGSVKVVYGDLTTNVGAKRRSMKLDPTPRLAKGDEVGRFEFGSTVVLLFEKERVKLRAFKPDEKVLLGQEIGKVLHS
jgi:phosphatidylserine decarboxylase